MTTDVHLWAFDIGALPPEVRALALEALGPDREGLTAARPNIDQTSLIRRGVLRLLLSEKLGVQVLGLRLETSSLGKLSVVGGPPFSISRNGDRFVVALCDERDTAVGVDLEPMLNAVTAGRLKAAALHPEERLRLSERTIDDMPREVLRIWTRKEAWAKAAGLGLHADFRRTQLIATADECFRAAGPAGDNRTWAACTTLELLPGYALTLVIEQHEIDPEAGPWRWRTEADPASVQSFDARISAMGRHWIFRRRS